MRSRVSGRSRTRTPAASATALPIAPATGPWAISPAPVSAIGRQGAAPEGGPLTLTDPSLNDGSRAKPIVKLPNAPEPA